MKRPRAAEALPASSRIGEGEPGGPWTWWRRHRRQVIRLWTAGVAASLAVTGASLLGYLEWLQARSVDLVVRLGAQPTPSDVVIVAIDDVAFDALGRRQPIPRDYLARVVTGLRRSGAAAAGIDITLSTATSAPDDAALAAALTGWSRHGVSLAVLVDGPAPAHGPLADPALAAAIVRGSDRIPVDRDGVIRRAAPLVPGGAGPPGPTLALATLAHVRAVDDPRLRDLLRRPGAPLPLPRWRGPEGWDLDGTPPLRFEAGELVRLNFVGPRGAFLTLPSDAVAALAEPGAAVAEDNPLRGRVALVGATFQDSRDVVHTPHGPLPGVEIHATLLHMLATRAIVQPESWATGLGVQLAVVGVAAVLLAWLRPLRGTLVSVALTVAVGVPVSYRAFHGSGYTIDFLLPVLATCLLGLAAEGLRRRRLRASFGRYVGREVMTQVLAENPSLAGERREVSILISDLRGFTTLSESLPAETVAARLNEYFPAMITSIFAHRGMISAFLGDGILAVFGAPLPDPEHAWHAARAAMTMQEALAALNRRWTEAGHPTLRMGIGIHTGRVFAGNVGGAARMTYTVVGDPVNVTARLEGLNKDLGTTMLITEETRRQLGSRVDVRYRGESPVKGRQQALRVYELLGTARGDGEAGRAAAVSDEAVGTAGVDRVAGTEGER